MNEEVRGLVDDTQLGLDVEAWLRGSIGSYVASRCESDRLRLLEELADVDPYDGRAVQAVQHKIKVIDAVMQYIADAVTAAHVAMARLDQLDQED